MVPELRRDISDIANSDREEVIGLGWQKSCIIDFLRLCGGLRSVGIPHAGRIATDRWLRKAGYPLSGKRMTKVQKIYSKPALAGDSHRWKSFSGTRGTSFFKQGRNKMNMRTGIIFSLLMIFGVGISHA